ncbi:hypothetical protein EDC04DRAFT_2501937, partial [Pisolithus marmoratus]
ELLCDVKSWWDSIYFMINHLWVLRQALDYFFMLPAQCDISNIKLEMMEWLILQDMELVLEISHLAQQGMSAESTPTLGAVVPAFEEFITHWQCL